MITEDGGTYMCTPSSGLMYKLIITGLEWFIEKFKTAAFEDLPTVKRELARVHIDKNSTQTYQGVENGSL